LALALHNLAEIKLKNKMIFTIRQSAILLTAAFFLLAGLTLVSPSPTFAADKNDKKSEQKGPGTFTLGPTTAPNRCGAKGDTAIKTSIDFGCVGKGSPMLDVTFAIIRFLSNGVGLVIIGSLIWGGIQYSGSRGDPQATALAVNRLQSAFYALLLFIFAFAMLNYLIPSRILR
jgi:hypothetical protein